MHFRSLHSRRSSLYNVLSCVCVCMYVCACVRILRLPSYLYVRWYAPKTPNQWNGGIFIKHGVEYAEILEFITDVQVSSNNWLGGHCILCTVCDFSAQVIRYWRRISLISIHAIITLIIQSGQPKDQMTAPPPSPDYPFIHFFLGIVTIIIFPSAHTPGLRWRIPFYSILQNTDAFLLSSWTRCRRRPDQSS
jgi:hypothetical protein